MRSVARRWDDFWFEPVATSTLGVLRICFGLVVFAWTVSLAPDLSAFFSSAGIVGAQPTAPGVWGVLGIAPGGDVVLVLYAALLVASVGLAAGWRTRLASVVVFVGLLSFERRDPWVFNSGDGLLRVIAFYVMLAPAGAAVSVDRWRRERERFWEFPSRAPWALRLMQIQLSVIYLGGVWDKLQGTTWNDGTAVSYALRVSDLAALPVPGFLSHSPVVVNLLTFGTLATEIAIGILVWNRSLRRWVLSAGVVFHLAIGWAIRVGFFSLGMLVLYLAFLDPDWTAGRLLRVRDRLAERRSRRAAGRVAAGPTD
ncbi:MAG TPA: HTTM domain-containing protein [Solirubrobacteraceae bacterium]|nr:HTTM domain-containing protein [Solirubrobacteraceae bacterium]